MLDLLVYLPVEVAVVMATEIKVLVEVLELVMVEKKSLTGNMQEKTLVPVAVELLNLSRVPLAVMAARES
jgi:hypothetical protein